MSIEPLLRCAVDYQTPTGASACSTVLLRGTTPQAHWARAARNALARQRKVEATRITNIRICLQGARPAIPDAQTTLLREIVQ